MNNEILSMYNIDKDVLSSNTSAEIIEKYQVKEEHQQFVRDAKSSFLRGLAASAPIAQSDEGL